MRLVSPRILAPALFLAALWPSFAGAFQGDSLVADFLSICIEGLPDASTAASIAEQRGYKELVEGIAPEIDAFLLNDVDFIHYIRADGGDAFISLRLAIKTVNNDAVEIVGSDVVSLGELGVTQGSVKQFAEDLSERLRLGLPVMDIVNSGHRERMWSTLVSYNRSSIILKELGADSNTAFTVGLIVPHQDR